MSRAEALGRNVLWFTLFVSLAGFLGYYDADGFVAPPPVIVLGLQVVGGLLAAVLLRDRLRVSLRGIAPLLLVAVWAAATLIWADDPVTAMRRWVLVFAPGLLLCALAASDPRPRQTFVWFVILVVTVTLLSGVFTALVLALSGSIELHPGIEFVSIEIYGQNVGISVRGRVVDKVYIPRFSGLTSNPNGVGLLAAIALIGLSGIRKPRTNSRRLGLVLVVAVVIAVLLMSGSRAALIAVVAGLFIATLLRMNCRKLVRTAVFVLCIFVPLLYLAPLLQNTSSSASMDFSEPPSCEQCRVSDLVEIGNNEILQLRERSDVWQTAIRALGDTWFKGLGFGMAEEATYEDREQRTSAHSIPLTVLLETGVVGLLLVLTTWLRPIYLTTKRGRKITNTDIAIVAILTALFVHQAVDVSVLRYHWAHFIFVYLIGASAGLSGSRTSE